MSTPLELAQQRLQQYLDAEARILQSQEYRDENASFFCDLVFFAEGRPYHMNSQTGQILSVGGLSATLCAEDLQSLLSLLEME